jgi:ATP-dependent RNA helicase RhlE
MQNNDTKVAFSDLGLSAKTLDYLKKISFHTPTPIQEKAIPVALKGKDVLGIAQTGTGKTLAFALPMIEKLSKSGGKALIIAPTRELALQVQAEVDKFAKLYRLFSTVIIGGAAMSRQIKDLKRRPHIIVATPGRLIDHIDRGTLRLNDVAVLIMDEADRMLDMGFAPQINKILESVPDKRQTMLFSATMPRAISEIAKRYMKDAERIEVARQGTSAQNIEQEFIIASKKLKFPLLVHLLEEYEGSILVFSRTKHGAKKITHQLGKLRYSASEIHSNRSLAQRKKAIADFTKGRSRILVATDIAARGIDVDRVKVVINYDLPDQTEDYVHRIGRTGRAGRSGKAISFAEPKQKRDMMAIERLVKKKIPVLKAPASIVELARAEYEEGSRERQNDRRNGSQNRYQSRSQSPSRGRSQGRSTSTSKGRPQSRSTGSSQGRPQSRSASPTRGKSTGGYKGQSKRRSYKPKKDPLDEVYQEDRYDPRGDRSRGRRRSPQTATRRSSGRKQSTQGYKPVKAAKR